MSLTLPYSKPPSVTCSYYTLSLLSTPVPMILLTHTPKRAHAHTHTPSVSWYSVRLFLVTSCVDFVEWVEVIWEWENTGSERYKILLSNFQTYVVLSLRFHLSLLKCQSVKGKLKRQLLWQMYAHGTKCLSHFHKHERKIPKKEWKNSCVKSCKEGYNQCSDLQTWHFTFVQYLSIFYLDWIGFSY